MRFFIIGFLTFFLAACDTKKFNKIPDNIFIGIWKYESKSIYNGMIIQIEKDKKDGSFRGIVKKLNDNKLVNFFIDSGFVLISDIKRNSNFEFSLTENKLGNELFSLYDLSTTETYNAQFVNNDLIVLSIGKINLNNITINLRRIKDPER